jgi:Ni/Fe-hydrogenase subunit HybB-like protein
MARIVYRELEEGPGFWIAVAGLGAAAAAGVGCAFYMESHGHIVTGMTNQIVWGLPHVFAVFLIVAASGILNMASLASVFSKAPYKPLSRLSGLMAIALLAGGLAVLVLDLGRPDRITVAMTTYNFKSIFAWNIFLYTGFFVIVGFYLYVQMAKGTESLQKPAGLAAFLWRLTLTTGTGSIFGWLIARQAYDAIMAPLFIAMSLSFGAAIFILTLMALYGATGRPLEDGLITRMGRLMAIFAAAVLYFTAVQQLANIYAPALRDVTSFILLDGGAYTALFWGAQVIGGGLIPIALVFGGGSVLAVALASVLIIIGGVAQVYVIIIGGQAFPLSLFPGMQVKSSFFDGVVNAYTPSMWEIGLGLGGVAIALLITVIGARALRVLPLSLSAEGK